MASVSLQKPATTLSRAGLALVCTAQFVDVLDVNVVLVALPSISRDVGLSGTGAQWLVTAYVVAFAGCLLLAGRLADAFGRRRMLMAGLALFAGASAVCGMAEHAGVLLAGRGAQGLGASLTAPAALAVITTSTRPGHERDRAIAAWTGVAAAGGAAGLVLGGVITEAIGWRWVFLLNVPVAAAAFALAPMLVPESRDPASGRRLDVLGAATVTGGLVGLVLGLAYLEPDRSARFGVIALTAGAALLALFVLVERRASAPLLPLAVVRSPGLAPAALVGGTLTAVTSSGAVICTLFLQDVRSFSPATAGLAALPVSVAVIAGSAVAGRLVNRFGPAPIAAGGLGLVCGAGIAATRMSTAAGVEIVVIWGALAGLGLGAASVAATQAGTAAVADRRRGVASGVLATCAQAGTAIGLAVLLTLAALRAGQGATAAATVDGFQLAMAIGAAAAAAAVPVALRLPRRSRGAPSDGERAQAPEPPAVGRLEQ